MSAHEFTIPAADLDAGGKEFQFTIKPSWTRGVLEGHEADATEKEGELQIRASKSGADVVVHGRMDLELQVPCARCLEPFSLPIHADLTVIYAVAARLKSPDAGTDEEYEFSADEADTLPFDGDTVVLDELVKDELLLEVPMIPLCSEACPGMSPAPGSNPVEPAEEKGIDPRLAPLLAFQAKTKKS
jgi:uncharacterized protein